MPTYTAKCNICGKVQEYFSKISERDTTPKCCEKPTERVILTAPKGYVDNPAFMSQYKHLYS